MTASKIYTCFDILKTEGILQFSPEDKLSKVLANLSSSHDALFIFDEKDKFLGVVSFVDIFRKGSVNEKSKIKNIVKMPPKLNLSSRLSVIAKNMLDSKIYFLPVFDNQDSFLGIVTVNRLISFVIKNNLLNGNDRILFSPRNILTANENEEVGSIISQMQKNKDSKVIILDENKKISGIVSRYDLKEIKLGSNKIRKQSRIGEKRSNLDVPIKDYMQEFIFSMKKIPSFSGAYELMKEEKVSSIIITDYQNFPINIITKTDLLNTIAENEI